MKKILVTIMGVILLLPIWMVSAEEPFHLVWTTFDPSTGEQVNPLKIEDGGTYSLALGEMKDIWVENDESKTFFKGLLYLIDSQSGEREFIAQVGGEDPGVGQLSWDKVGSYELDIYLYVQLVKEKPWWQIWARVLGLKVVYADDLPEPLGTIKFSITNEVNGKIPVIIVPGIMGTELLEDKPVDQLIWPNTLSIALSVTDDFMDVLKMDNNGLPTFSNIIYGEFLVGVGNEDYWGSLISTLNEKSAISTFPYDWRMDIRTTSLRLKNEIDKIKLQTGTEKIDIIAHSMGGLVVKNYFNNYGGDSIGKFIDLGTPHVGSPKALKILNYGDDLGASFLRGMFGLNSQRIKVISQNMPSIYEMLPSQKYFNVNDPHYEYYVFNGVGDSSRLDFRETKEYMKAAGRNSLLVDRADQFHQEIDDLDPADYGVKAYNFVGCGTPTIGQFYILDDDSDDPIYDIHMINGDGTVPLKSAEALSAIETYYVKNAKHTLMPSTSGVKELVSAILTSTSTDDFDISPYSNLALTANGCDVPDGQMVSLHSPIELHIYDLAGNHVGPTANGDIEYNIPDVSYEVIDGNKFAFLPDGVSYSIKGKATGGGTFDARVKRIEDGEVVETKYFNDVPLTKNTKIEIQPTFIMVDKNGDGKTKSTILPTAILDENQSLDVIKPVTTLSTNPIGKKEKNFDKPTQVILVATDENSGVLQTEYYTDKMDKKENPRWKIYTKPFEIRQKGETKVFYRSVDKAGNVESTKSATIVITTPVDKK